MRLPPLSLRAKFEMLTSSTLLSLGILAGVSLADMSNFQKYALSASSGVLMSGAGFVVYRTLTDKQGLLQLEVVRLEGEIKSLTYRLEETTQERDTFLNSYNEVHSRVSGLQEIVEKQDWDLQLAISDCEDWEVAANKAYQASQVLKHRLEEQQNTHQQAIASLKKRHGEEIHKRVKTRSVEIASKLYKNYDRKTQQEVVEVRAELTESANLQIAHYQSRIAELNAEIEQLQSDAALVNAEKKQLVEALESLHREDLPDIRHTFEREWSENDRQLQLAIDQLQCQYRNAQQMIDELKLPRRFRGETSVDKAGNRIIDHFASSAVILDAIESVKIPGGFQLRFKVDRNLDSTKLAESEFDKHCEHLGLWGLSQRPLDFDLDTRNFLLSVNLYAVPDGKQRSTPLIEAKRSAVKAESPSPEMTAERFQELDCYSAAEFEEVVRLKFVPRVRVVAGSTGGKSPLLELIACAIAQIHKGEIWLINPIPGSPKDWFHVPGVISPGSNGIEAAIDWLGKAHQAFTTRRNDLPGTAQKPFITVVVDEINAIARDFPDLGTVMKDFYQLSDHTRMGFLTAGQGGNVSGVSGGSKSATKTGNASKLMEEDFQNATQVFTAAAAKVWIEKHLKGSQMNAFLDRLAALNELCAELNESEGKAAYPTDPTVKKVSPDAYRVALVVSPREPNPFFVQLPPYSSYLEQLTEVTYPASAIVTAPKENQILLGLIDSENGKPKSACTHCGSESFRRKGKYKVTGKPKYVCSQCGRVPSLQNEPIETLRQTV